MRSPGRTVPETDQILISDDICLELKAELEGLSKMLTAARRLLISDALQHRAKAGSPGNHPQ